MHCADVTPFFIRCASFFLFTLFFFFNDTATTEIYTLSLHDTLPISQIKPDRQLLLGKIPALLTRYGANLLHCRSPFYLCFEHVDNLGAYSIPSETGLLIPSVNSSYRQT